MLLILVLAYIAKFKYIFVYQKTKTVSSSLNPHIQSVFMQFMLHCMG